MRFEGTVRSWNADKGFGFITPNAGGQDIFLHISELGRAGAPTVNERLSFEVALNAEGKKRAVRVQRASAFSAHARSPSRSQPALRMSRAPGSSGSGLKTVIALLLVLVLGWQGYTRFAQPRLQPVEGNFPGPATPVPSVVPQAVVGPDPLWQPKKSTTRSPVATRSLFICDGRQHCSQMRSCEEATYFLKNCPGTKMDGDGDGIPCEQQLCR